LYGRNDMRRDHNVVVVRQLFDKVERAGATVDFRQSGDKSSTKSKVDEVEFDIVDRVEFDFVASVYRP